MNGKQQVQAMQKLMNTDQKAPNGQAWQPDALAGFRIGDNVRLKTVSTR